MAASGAALVAFVIAHLIGNLQIFLGPEAINRYGHFLQTTPEILWPMRLGLLAVFILHIVTSVQLTIESRAARPVAYEDKTYIKASLASRTMMITGILILSFVIYHLLHFTLHKVHPQYSQLFDTQGRHDVYSMMVLSFQQPSISITYVILMFCVCFHLSHGISSMFQSLGFNTVRIRRPLTCTGSILAWLIFIGYCSIPAACLLGWIALPVGVIP
jgi:succinate dehydrogenase / fumarate reductase, cytochrome b subunit